MQTIEKIEEKVDRLENVLEKFITHTDIALNRLERELEKEMKIFREETGKDREERQRDREERAIELQKERDERQKSREKLEKDMEKFWEKMRKDREEWAEKMQKDREEMRKEFNKQWAALATKMGTIDEDLVAPAVRPVLSKHFNCEFNTRTIRVLRRIGGEDY